MEDKKIDRDVSIDFIRIIACILVVGTHCCLQAFNEYYHEVDWSRLFEKCFLTDGVPIFFMITGFFIANGRSYKKIWKSTLFKVIIPTLIYVLFAQVFFMFIINKESLLWCFKNFFVNLNIRGIFQSVLTTNTAPINSLCEHLWYIFSYIKIVIWIPILWLLCREEKRAIFARRMVLLFGIIGMTLIDIQRFAKFSFGEIRLLQFVDRELIYVILGYELFVNKDRIKKNNFLCVIRFFGIYNCKCTKV